MMGNVSLAERSAEIEMHPSGALESPHGAKVRIGLIILSTDTAIERDFHKLAPSDDIGIFSTRIYLETPNSDRTLGALEHEIEAAVKLIIPSTRLDCVVFGCTSASTLIGPERIRALVERGRPGLAATNPATAALLALKSFGARKVALVTPYTKDMAANVVNFLVEGGLGLTSARAVGFDNDDAIGSISGATFIEAVRRSDLTGADAIFISCTAVKAIDQIEAIEAEFGLPVITSNQAAFWHALKLAGWTTPIKGYGRLLSEMR